MRSSKQLEIFKLIISNYYLSHKRDLAWRTSISPYNIVVSEIMLQQTQVERVKHKFELFIQSFPDFKALAQASFAEVLGTWKGLGYNRRALALHKIAQLLVNNYNNEVPKDPSVLQSFPGIGKATARSIISFAFNTPTVFIETNIRTVFIYFFFSNKININDKEIYILVEKTLDKNNPRDWYYALMDYGAMLKKHIGNLSRLSAHYAKQSKFEGSNRQIRGLILQILLEHKSIDENKLLTMLNKDKDLIIEIINNLEQEGYLELSNNIISLKN